MKPQLVTLHHPAGSGGTLVTRIFGCSDEFAILNEKHPLQVYFNPKHLCPTILIEEIFSRQGKLLHANNSPEKINSFLATKFFNELNQCVGLAASMQCYVLFRDWSHVDFFKKKNGNVGLVREHLKAAEDKLNINSFVTIRHPIDVFLSGLRNGFFQELDNNFSEFCARYTAFYNYYNQPNYHQFKYEDIVENPQGFVDSIINITGARFPENWESNLDRHALSGDSGRSSNKIAPRPRREEDMEHVHTMAQRDEFKRLANLMGYPETVY